MVADWEHLLARIRRDRRSGASALLAHGIKAARLFLVATRGLPRARLNAALERFTLRLVEAQPSMASLLTLANALWLGRGEAREPSAAWRHLHDALIRYPEGMDRNLAATVRRASGLIRTQSLVLTYSNSTAVRLALWRAMAVGQRFQVVCSESRPMREGVVLARQLATLGIPVHLVVDAALARWVGLADLVVLGADAILREVVVNKVGTEELLHAAHRARVGAYVLADSSKWLPDALAAFWRIREEAAGEIAPIRNPNVTVHNRYFDRSPLGLLTGVVWEGGVADPTDIRRRVARLPVSRRLVRLLKAARP